VVWRYPECKSVSSHFSLSTKCGNCIEIRDTEDGKKGLQAPVCLVFGEDVAFTVAIQSSAIFKICHF
jgi:hypothetical protein